MPKVVTQPPSTVSQERLDLLAKLHDQSLELLRPVVFDKRPHCDGYLICLYASMIELCGGIVLLVANDRKTSLSPVFRTFLEAYVDFKIAAEDRSYVKHSYARHHKDWIKVLNTRDNLFLASILVHEQREAALERHEVGLKKLEAEGVRVLRVNQKFAKAEMTDEYRSIYHFESDATHNSWQAMIGRHFVEGQDDFGLTLYKPHSLEDYETYLDATAALLLDATAKVQTSSSLEGQKRLRLCSKNWLSYARGLRKRDETTAQVLSGARIELGGKFRVENI